MFSTTIATAADGSNNTTHLTTSTSATVPLGSVSFRLTSSPTVKSTVTAQSNEDTSTATIAPSVSSTTHFSSLESSASVKSVVTAQASSTNTTNPMVASVQSNSTTENTVSAAENNYNSVTATISNTPMASSYMSPSLVTKFLVPSLSVESLAPIPSAGGTTVVSVDTSSHFKPSDSTISPTNSSKMSSLFVSSSATVLPKPSSVGPISGNFWFL